MLKRIRVLFLALVFAVLWCMPAVAETYVGFTMEWNGSTFTHNGNGLGQFDLVKGETAYIAISSVGKQTVYTKSYVIDENRVVIGVGDFNTMSSGTSRCNINLAIPIIKTKQTFNICYGNEDFSVGQTLPVSYPNVGVFNVNIRVPSVECVSGVRQLKEGYSSTQDNRVAAAGVPVGGYWVSRRSVIHGGKLLGITKRPGNDCIISTYEFDIKVPCGVYVVADGLTHELTSNNCHLVMDIPTVGRQNCGEDRTKWAKPVDDTWVGTKLGEAWVDASSSSTSHTNDYIWHFGVYHGDSDNDGLCDGCGQPTDGMDLSHTHNFVQKYYDHNGVPNAYWVYECECGEQQDGVKHFTQFTINFDVNGGQGSFTNLTINAGDTVNIPNVEPTRTGYIFKGWSTVRNGNKEYDKGQQVIPKKSTTYYAVWEGKKYKISFETAGVGTVNEIQVTYGSPIGTLPSPVTNTRWRTEDGTFVTSTTIYNWDENITLYLYEDVVLRAVTFVGGSQSQIVNVKDGSTVDPPFNPTESGYVFKWWSTSRTGSAFDFTTPIKQDITLYAVMEGNRVIITLPGCGEKEYTYPSQIGELPVPTQPNAEFGGWYWDAECTQPVSPDEQVPMYDTPLYPKFDKEQYTVELEGYDPLIISKGDYIPKLPTPERPGETFLGWFMGDTEIKQGDLYEWDYAITVKPKFETNTFMVTLPNGEIRVVHEGDSIGDIPTGVVQPGTRVTGFKNQYDEIVDSSTRVYGNLTITPVIERDRITLTLMDGDTQYNVIDVDAGLKITDLPTLSKEGYTFRGWSTMKGGSVTMGPFVTDTTLYAVYAAEKQTIVLEELNQTVEKLTGSQIGSLPAPVKDGYEFNGWLWNGSPVTAETVVPPGGMTLIPSWEKVVVDTTRFVTIRYWSDNIRINTVDMNPGEILYNPGEPALDILKERTFAYWANRDGSVYEFGHRISSDLDLYAVWQ